LHCAWASRPPVPRTHRAVRSGPGLFTALVVAFTACASVTPSREPLVSDRPDFTESTSTVQRGDVQAEGGYTFSRTEGDRSSTAGELLVRIGVMRRAELRVEPGSYAWVKSDSGKQSGRDDAEIGTKLRLHNAEGERPSPLPAVSLILKSTVPTGSAAFRQNRMQPEVGLATEWTLARHVALGANLDAARPVGDDGQRYTQFAVSASFGFDLSLRIGAFAEAFGFVPEISGARHTGYLDTGLTAAISPDLQFDLRGGIGVNGTAPDYFIGAGLVRRW